MCGEVGPLLKFAGFNGSFRLIGLSSGAIFPAAFILFKGTSSFLPTSECISFGSGSEV